MVIDYDRIREENIEEYGKGTRHLEFFNLLYSDRTHFIFELLQNAEDAGATQIFFKLDHDKLEVMHDGRLFNENDVRGICGIDLGTKKDDLTQIGKFGIGFKSVYAYTLSPEIHSGAEHFKIESYVRPFQIEFKEIDEHWTTLIVLHLDAKELDKNKACNDIGYRLANLSANTLLFLKKIKEIKYNLPNQNKGSYQRKVKADDGNLKQITVVESINNVQYEENWLVFEKPIHTKDITGTISIEIAFKVSIDPATNKMEIKKVEESPLYVYFPTEKETRLGFLIQGPYRTTPSRDNIPREDSWNNTLIVQTADFIVECLEMLKKNRLLTVNTLLMLPIKSEDFPRGSMFQPIFEAVKTAFLNDNLLPTDDNSFASAGQVKLAYEPELRGLLRQEHLNVLFKSNKDIKWLSGGITQERTPDLKKYLTKVLEIEEITPEWFAGRVTEAFFVKQTDDWMIEFYKYISGRKELWRSGRGYGVTTGPLYNKRFVRLQDGSHVKPFNNDGTPNAFISEDSNMKTNYPIVKFEICKHKEALQFLNNLGIPELDVVEEVIETLVPKYSSSTPVPVSEHLQDIERIKRAWDTDSQGKKRRLKKTLQEVSIILAEISGAKNLIYVKPTSAYFPNTELIDYFEGNKEIGFVSSKYDEDTLDIFKDLGVSEKVRIKKGNINPKGFVIISDISGQYERGLDGFDPGIEVEGLLHALKNPTPRKSEYIWNNIALQNSNCIFGAVERSTRKTYSKAQREEKYSPFGRLLVENKWLPKAESGYFKPRELTLEELPSTYIKDKKLADKLGMQTNAEIKLADNVGISLEDIDFLKRYYAEFEKLKKEIIDREKHAFREMEVNGPDRKERVGLTVDSSINEADPIKLFGTSTASSPKHIEIEHAVQSPMTNRAQNEAVNGNFKDSRLDQSNHDTIRKKDMTKAEQKDREESSKGSGPSKEQHARQRRLLSYVSFKGLDDSLDHDENEKDDLGLRIGEKAVQIVIEDETINGRKARFMGHSNPGYDIVSENDTEKRYIEVKGTKGSWSERGVSLTSTQLFYAKESQNQNYWLYVVENVFSDSPQVHKIFNPIDKIDYFIFDGGWKQASDGMVGNENESSIPCPGDDVLSEGKVIGIILSILSYGKYSLAIYKTSDGSQHKRLLSEITIRPKEKE